MDYEQLPSLPMGVRFRPNQQELLLYLRHKLAGEPLGNDPIADVDVYDSEPGDLPSKSKLKKEARKWYFYSRLDKKYGKKSSKINRETSKGQWKITAPDVKVCYNSRTSGFSGTRKVLTFYSRQGGGLVRTNWGMHEYSLGDKESYGNSHVLCKIFRKPHDEAVGGEAPSGEASREHDDVAAVAPGETPPTGVAVGDGGYAEAANLSQDVNHSGVFIEDYQLPIGGTSKTSELHPDPKFVHILEQHGMDAEPWTDGFIEEHDLVTPMEADAACLGPHDSQKDVDSWVFVEDYQQPNVGTSQTSELHPDEKNVHNQEHYGMVAKPLKDKYFVEPSDCTNAFDNPPSNDEFLEDEDPVYVGLADDPDMCLDLSEIFPTEITGSSVTLKNEVVGADQMSKENLSACFDISEFLNLDGCSDVGLSLSEISGTENTGPRSPAGGDGHKHV